MRVLEKDTTRDGRTGLGFMEVRVTLLRRWNLKETGS